MPLRTNTTINNILPADASAHDWYRFVLAFPPHIVRDYLKQFEVGAQHCVLDPFCGTGTTVIEAKKKGIPAVGIEANPLAHFASEVKTDWTPDPDRLLSYASDIEAQVTKALAKDDIEDTSFMPQHLPAQPRTLTPEEMDIILTNSISPLPLHKTLVLRDYIYAANDERYQRHVLLALAKGLVGPIGNLHFGPEVGVGKSKLDAPVISIWMQNVRRMVDHLRVLQQLSSSHTHVYHADSRDAAYVLEPNSIDMVITSPPYPNEKDYTRTTRLESTILGFLRNKADLRSMKQGLLRSNTRNVYVHDDDDRYIAQHDEIQMIADTIEQRRIDMGKTSGFEKLYGRTTKLYFGGMARHLECLKTVLRPGAYLAYVVGDQASYLQVMIETGRLLAEVAENLGYERVRIDLFRTRLATATRAQLREEVVILRWPG